MPALLSAAQQARFHADGFVIVRGMFDAAETDLLRRRWSRIPRSPAICSTGWMRRARRRASRCGTAPAIRVYGMAARCARMVDTMEALLGGPVYHFQSKLTAKEPFVGGAWEWHQDYGYWYHNGCIFPHLASCQVALDRSTTRERLPADGRRARICSAASTTCRCPARARTSPIPARMRHILQRLPVVPCELEPGDAVFFHANTLHRSDQNRSPHRRWTLICCYNRVDNDTVVREHDRYYVPLEKVPDSAVKAAGLRFASGDEHFTSRPFVPKVA